MAEETNQQAAAEPTATSAAEPAGAPADKDPKAAPAEAAAPKKAAKKKGAVARDEFEELKARIEELEKKSPLDDPKLKAHLKHHGIS